MGIYARHNDEWYRVDDGGSSGGSAWGDFTTNGDEQDSGTWGPDAQGRMWKWAEWNEAKDYTVNLTGGLYHVLTVGGGSRNRSAGDGYTQGSPGVVNEGYWEFPANSATPITVGKKGLLNAGTDPANYGQPSSIGSFGTQGITVWGAMGIGRGATGYPDNTGYKSFITGTGSEYGTGYQGDEAPGRSGSSTDATNKDGCVIIATVTNEQSDWNQPGALPGLGGWATITDVKGKGTKYSYGDWVAFEWTTDGELTTQAGGLVDALIVGGGGYGADVAIAKAVGPPGQVFDGVREITGTNHPVSVGAAGTFNGEAGASALGSWATWKATWGMAWSGAGDGRVSSITGQNKNYAMPHTSAVTGPGKGGQIDGLMVAPTKGVVIVRVPKSNYTGNLPDGAFDIPTTRQTIVEALEEKVEEAKEAVRDRRKRR